MRLWHWVFVAAIVIAIIMLWKNRNSLKSKFGL